MKELGVVAAALGLLACTTYFPANEPLDPGNRGPAYRASRIDPDDSSQLVLALAFSGGGTRAAAFAFGVLEELAATEVELGGRARRLIDEVDSVSGVSGGSFVAAYFGLHGARALETFPERFLERNVQRALILRLLSPLNWIKLFSPYWARSDLAANYYDGNLFDGATFGDLVGRGHPFLQIHATDLTTGSPFAFIQEQFDYLCSDLSSYPLARVVAASSAVPLILSPITLRNYHHCGYAPPDWVLAAARERRTVDRTYLNAKNLLSYREPRRRYIRLVDGGISDNLGVRGPFESWFQRTSAPPEREGSVPVRWVVLIVVNAQTMPDAEWDRFRAFPSLLRIVDAATSVQIQRYNLETTELLRRTFDLWNEHSAGWDPPLHYHLLELSFLDVPDPEERDALNRLGTSLHLPHEATQRLRRAARQALRDSATFQKLLGELAAARAVRTEGEP